MVKILLFVGLVFFGVILVLAISSQGNKTPLNAALSPTPNTNALTTPLAGQTASPSPAPSASPSPTVTVPAAATATIKTSKGDIVLTLYGTDAPNTVANFISKANSGYYNNLKFHRVEDWVIQGGDPKGDGTGGGNMPVEFNSKPFVVGALGVASRGDGKVQNDSQFFITKKDSEFLNGKYTNFGIVTAGMDVVNNIAIGDKIRGITIQ